MISPFTCVTLVMFAGSGLYLYQAKHLAEVETREIRRLVAEADLIRQRTGMLVTEYQLENDSELLGKLAARFLPQLKPTQPPQFAGMADLPTRLPPVGLPPPAPDAPAAELVYAFPPAPATVAAPRAVATAADDAARAPGKLAAASSDVPARPKPAPVAHLPAANAQLAASGRPASASPVATADPPAPRAPVPQVSPVLSTVPAYSYGLPYGAPGASTGSALGMARTMGQRPFMQPGPTPTFFDGGRG